MINGIFIITSKGESLIVRSFRGDKMPQLVSAYRTAVLGTDARLALRDKEKSEDARNETPIRMLGSTSFFHIKQNDLNFVAVAKENVNAAATFEFLWKFVTILRAYFGTEFSDITIRNNFVLIYELLDETMDYGYPQVCEPDLLKLYITQTGIGADGKKIEVSLRAICAHCLGETDGRKKRRCIVSRPDGNDVCWTHCDVFGSSPLGAVNGKMMCGDMADQLLI
eukprot:TRINITY_DN1527_c0_g1_i6.p1 TRINITY_DN1527_c0_g1~~TRINITY_DN1527_c0_g1_i6.p1  ORF type:complete len:224 (+),score=68.88 TRINITY_DN1527_c0_g1_i6:159-830(+)